ncbi:LssY C-terminal domain-containing protein [soil metagenome]
MTVWLVRVIKRILIFLTGAAVVYLAVWKFFPFFDNRIPVALALLATYIFTAYVFIPAGIRLYRLFVRPNHIPLYCVTPDGFASDPINIGIIGTRVQIKKAMRRAGWYMPDKKTPRALWRVFKATIRRQPYPNTPFSNLYLFGRRQDLGFALPIEGSASMRHHVRFWACHFDGPEAFHDHVRFWKRLQRPLRSGDNRQLWVGAVSKDIGLLPIRHNAQITHSVDPNTDAERELIIKSLKLSGNVENVQAVKVGAPYELRNRTIGGYLRTDGKMLIAILKD